MGLREGWGSCGRTKRGGVEGDRVGGRIGERWKGGSCERTKSGGGGEEKEGAGGGVVGRREEGKGKTRWGRGS